MKRCVLLCVLLLCCLRGSFAQNQPADSLAQLLKKTQLDTVKLMLLSDLVFHFANNNPEKANQYAAQQMALARKVNLPKFTANALNDLAIVAYYQGNYSEALGYNQKALAIREKLGNTALVISSLNKIALVY